jgi:DNA-binding transcriptional ArsR family regulator
MKVIDKKIILALYDKLPMTISEISSAISGKRKRSLSSHYQTCKYHINNMKDAEIITAIEVEGNTTLFKLNEDVEILEGYITLKDKDGNIKYENETIGRVLRIIDTDGYSAIAILDTGDDI